MTYGIDQLVQDKADAYRGNPAALQKRSAMSKELIDMLALQKITSEKDAAARDMQLKMEQQPGTIAQQLEQKAMGQTKNEMLEGVAGVMKTNQAKQQANMQRMASAGIPKSAAAGPPPQGLAGQSKPNMQMMAQGGIVGYAPGGTVQEKADKIAEIRKKIAAGTITKAAGEAQIEAIAPTQTPDFSRDPKGALRKDSGLLGKGLNLLGVPTSEVADLEAAQRQETGAKLNYEADMRDMPYREAAAAAGAPTSGRVMQDDKPMVGASPNAPMPIVGQGAQLGATTNVSPPMQGPPVGLPAAQPPAPEKPDEITAGLAGLPALSDPKLTAQQITAGTIDRDAVKRGEVDQGIKALDAQRMALASNQMATNPEDAFDRMADKSDKRLNRSGVADRYKSIQDKLAALDAEQTDPRKLRDERLMATLLGASTSDPLGGRAGFAAASQQNVAKRQRVMDALGLEMKAIDVDVGIGKEGVALGKAAVEQSYQHQRQGQLEAGKLSDAANAKLDAEADRILNMEKADLEAQTSVDVANVAQRGATERTLVTEKGANARAGLQASIAELKILSSERMRMEIQRSTDLNFLSRTLATVVKNISDVYDGLTGTDTQFQMLSNSLLATDNPNKRAELQAKLQARHKELFIMADKIVNKGGSLTLRKTLEDKINSLSGVSGPQNTGGITAANIASVTQTSP